MGQFDGWRESRGEGTREVKHRSLPRGKASVADVVLVWGSSCHLPARDYRETQQMAIVDDRRRAEVSTAEVGL